MPIPANPPPAVAPVPALLLTLVMLGSLLPLGAVGGPSGRDAPVHTLTYDLFIGGQSTVDLVLDGGPPATGANPALSLQDGLTIPEAELMVSGGPHATSGTFALAPTIDIGDDGDVDWAFTGSGYGALGQQTFFEDGTAYANGTIKPLELTNSSYGLLLPRGATVTSATAAVTVSAVNVAVECAPAAANCGVGAEADDVVDALRLEGLAVTKVAGTDIDTAGELAGFTVVVLGSSMNNGDNDWDSFASPLRTYVQGGGGFVTTGPLGDSSGPADLAAISPVSLQGCWSCRITDQFTVTDPLHPVTAGVVDFNSDNMGYSSILTNGGVDIAELGCCGGNHAAAVANIGTGRSVWLGPGYMVDTEWGWGAGPAGDAQGVRLLKQAVTWASGDQPMDASVDVGADGDDEWSANGFSGTAPIPDFTAELNAHLAAMPPTLTDEWGNAMVEIPLDLIGSSAGVIKLSDLEVTYQWKARVAVQDVGTLAQELDGQLGPTPSDTMVTILASASADTEGQLVLSDPHIVGVPPVHPPHFVERTPDTDAFSVGEGTTQALSVVPGDIYGNPVNVSWDLDGGDAGSGVGWNYTPDFEDAGSHLITVTLDNGLATVSHLWEVTVTEVNRDPIVLTTDPAQELTIAEASTTDFYVEAIDPDGTGLTYSWYIDEVLRGTTFSGDFTYTTDYHSSGQHALRVDVTDPEVAKATFTWTVTVTDVNALTTVIASRPAQGAKVSEQSSLTFSVTAKSPDDDPLEYAWSLDGQPLALAQSPSWSYMPDYDGAGTHGVEVVINDGHEPVTHSWAVDVLDVNRPPTAVISAPTKGVQWVRGSTVSVEAAGSTDPDKDALEYQWLLDGKTVASGREAAFKVDKAEGTYTLTLEVDDGKGAVGVAELTVKVISLALRAEIIVSPELEVGQDHQVTVKLTNVGNAQATDVDLTLLFDDAVVGNSTLASTKPGENHQLTFTIHPAKEGKHMLTLRTELAVLATKEVSVTPPPVPLDLRPNSSGSLLPLLLLAAVLAAVGIVAAVLVMRRRKAAAVPAPQPPTYGPYGSGSTAPPSQPGAWGPPPGSGPAMAPTHAPAFAYGPPGAPGAPAPPPPAVPQPPWQAYVVAQAPGPYAGAPPPYAPPAPGGYPSAAVSLNSPEQVAQYLDTVEAELLAHDSAGNDTRRAWTQLRIARQSLATGAWTDAGAAGRQALGKVRDLRQG